MPLLQILIASTRAGRKGHLLGAWIEDLARQHGQFEIEVIDLADVDLPMFDESTHPRLASYEHEHSIAWSRIVDRADAYIFVTPEYDHVPPASLLNAIQYLVREWAYKPLGFVSYGGVSAGTRAVQVLKQIAVALKMMPIPEAVHVPFFTRHIDPDRGTFRGEPGLNESAEMMLTELRRWTDALEVLRRPEAVGT